MPRHPKEGIGLGFRERFAGQLVATNVEGADDGLLGCRRFHHSAVETGLGVFVGKFPGLEHEKFGAEETDSVGSRGLYFREFVIEFNVGGKGDFAVIEGRGVGVANLVEVRLEALLSLPRGPYSAQSSGAMD